MNYSLRICICVGLISLAQSHVSFAQDGANGAVRLAALDSPNGPPPCGQDGACNLAVCRQDPDCPDDLPPRNDGESLPSSALDGIINCDATQDKDILAVAWNIVDDWTNFDNAIVRQTSFRLGDCTQDRFSSNGRVECMAGNVCNNRGCRQGYSIPSQQRIRIYPSFLTRIAALPQADRRACYAALMTHEFTHSCWRAEGRPEAREDAAFDYWTARFPGTSGHDVNGGCGLD